MYVHLQMEKKDKLDRLRERHEGGGEFIDMLEKMNFDEVGEEEGQVVVNVSGSMSREDVMKAALDRVAKIGTPKAAPEARFKKLNVDCKYCFM